MPIVITLDKEELVTNLLNFLYSENIISLNILKYPKLQISEIWYESKTGTFNILYNSQIFSDMPKNSVILSKGGVYKFGEGSFQQTGIQIFPLSDE